MRTIIRSRLPERLAGKVPPRSLSSGSGLGRKLVETFARHLEARVEVSTSAEGTTRKIVIPALA
jgi:hypothetical protein